MGPREGHWAAGAGLPGLGPRPTRTGRAPGAAGGPERRHCGTTAGASGRDGGGGPGAAEAGAERAEEEVAGVGAGPGPWVASPGRPPRGAARRARPWSRERPRFAALLHTSGTLRGAAAPGRLPSAGGGDAVQGVAADPEVKEVCGAQVEGKRSRESRTRKN